MIKFNKNIKVTKVYRELLTSLHSTEKYFKKIKAPKKELFFIKNAGHMTMLDQPSEFYNALCKCTE